MRTNLAHERFPLRRVGTAHLPNPLWRRRLEDGGRCPPYENRPELHQLPLMSHQLLKGARTNRPATRLGHPTSWKGATAPEGCTRLPALEVVPQTRANEADSPEPRRGLTFGWEPADRLCRSCGFGANEAKSREFSKLLSSNDLWLKMMAWARRERTQLGTRAEETGWALAYSSAGPFRVKRSHFLLAPSARVRRRTGVKRRERTQSSARNASPGYCRKRRIDGPGRIGRRPRFGGFHSCAARRRLRRSVEIGMMVRHGNADLFGLGPLYFSRDDR
jgi:hypothetical protein